MSIRRHGNRWQVRVTISGRRVERSVPPGATRADARALEAALLRRATDHASGRPTDRLIDEAIAQWEPQARLLKTWAKDIRYKLVILTKYTRGKNISEIPEVARKFTRDCLDAGLKPASVNRYLSILRRLASLSERWGWTELSLSKRVEMLTGEEQRHIYLTVEQVQKLSNAAKEPFRSMILLLALTGLRKGELMRLTQDNIVNGAILLDANTKSGRPRRVPLPPEALRIAQAALPLKVSSNGFQRAFAAAREAVGLSHVRAHDLRYTYASWLIETGAGLVEVRNLLGHSSLAVTSRYSHLADEHLQVAVSRLPRVSSGSE